MYPALLSPQTNPVRPRKWTDSWWVPFRAWNSDKLWSGNFVKTNLCPPQYDIINAEIVQRLAVATVSVVKLVKSVVVRFCSILCIPSVRGFRANLETVLVNGSVSADSLQNSCVCVKVSVRLFIVVFVRKSSHRLIFCMASAAPYPLGWRWLRATLLTPTGELSIF